MILLYENKYFISILNTMSKTKDERLFRLIKSLTKSEKRLFKIYSNRLNDGDKAGKKFLLLFEAIDKQATYDEGLLLKKNQQLTKIQLPNLKNHLYQQILKYLRISPKNYPLDMQLTEILDHAKILYHKCLYRDALKLIDKAKKIASNSDNSFILLELLELEKLALQQGMKDNIEDRVHEIVSEIEATAKSIQHINIFSNLSLQLNAYYQKIGFVRNSEDLKSIKKFFKESLPEYEEERLSFQEKLYLYYSYTGYYFFIQDFESGLKTAQKWVDLFEQNPSMIPIKIELYIKSLNSLLVVQNKLYHYHDFMNTHRKLVAIKRNKSIQLTENINLTLFRAIYIHEINRHFMLGEFKSGIKIVSKFSDELNNFLPQLDKHSVFILYYKIACLYFGSSNFKNALKWLNLIINDQATEIREDIHSFARILRLICYYELNDQEMIEYSIRSTYRFLKKKRSFIQYQDYIIEFLKNLRKNNSKKEIIELFTVLKNEMKALEKDKFERKAFIYFDIISYLESKISERSIQEVVREKARKKIFDTKAA